MIYKSFFLFLKGHFELFLISFVRINIISIISFVVFEKTYSFGSCLYFFSKEFLKFIYLSTSVGILTDFSAREKRIGGEVLFYIW
jgi:ribosomal protein S8